MKSVGSDNRLTVGPYHDALEGVETQFALIRFALTRVSKSSIREFFKTRLADQAAAMSEKTESLATNLPKEQREKVQRGLEYYLRDWRKGERKKHRSDDTRFEIELSEDRINQSELVLLVAHFESFMKQVHRTFLTAAPARVFSDSDTKVMLRDVFDSATPNPFDKFLTELIIKEVKRLDAQRIEQRATYFADHFGVSFGPEGEITELKEIMTARNKIAHEIYTRSPSTLEEVKEQPLVSDQMLQRARWLFWDIPRRCVQAGVKEYPAYFR